MLQINIDGLFSPQCVIHEFHQWLMTGNQICEGNSYYHFDAFVCFAFFSICGPNIMHEFLA
jgi:hypothetical protein